MIIRSTFICSLFVVQLESYYFLMKDVITFVQNLAFAIIMLKRLTAPCAHLWYICYLFCSSAFGVFNQKILMLVRVMAAPYHTSGNLSTCIFLPRVPLFMSGSTNTKWLERASTSRHSLHSPYLPPYNSSVCMRKPSYHTSGNLSLLITLPFCTSFLVCIHPTQHG